MKPFYGRQRMIEGRVPSAMPDILVGSWFCWDFLGEDVESMDSVERTARSKALTNWVAQDTKRSKRKYSVKQGIDPATDKLCYIITRVG